MPAAEALENILCPWHAARKGIDTITFKIMTLRIFSLPVRFPVLLLLALGLALPGARAVDFVLFKNIWGDVIVATDTTTEGHALTPPSPQQPVYFRGLSLGRKLGSIPGDHEPDVQEVNQVVTKILAKQGYLAARPGIHEPTLFLVVQWGYMEPERNNLLWFFGYDPAQDIAAPASEGFLGMDVFRRDMRSHSIDTILTNAREASYGIIVTAFEFKSAKTPKPVVYWQTRIGLPANGKSMAAALPTMLLTAGPAIGRESKTPTLLDADDVREGRVNLGELKILDVIGVPHRSPEPGAKN